MKAAILNASTLGTDKYTARLAAALARLVSVAGLPLSELPLSDCAASVTDIRRLSGFIGGKQQRPDVQANELLEQYSLMKQVLQTQAEAQFASLSELDWSDEHRAFTERFVRDLCGLVEAFGTGCTQRAVAAFSEGHCEQIGMLVNEAPSPERHQHPSASLQKLASMPCITGIEATMNTFQQKVNCRTWISCVAGAHMVSCDAGAHMEEALCHAHPWKMGGMACAGTAILQDASRTDHNGATCCI